MTLDPQRVGKDSTGLLQAIATYLAAETTMVVGTDLFIQHAQEDPVVVTVVVHTGGITITGDPTRRPTFQILHRNDSQQTGLSKSVEINRLLEDQWNVLTGYPGRITAVSEPGAYFVNEAGVFEFPLNYVFVSTFQS
jgi:hypothetical protein